MFTKLKRKYYGIVNSVNRVRVWITGERRNYVYSNLFPVLRNRRRDIFEQVRTGAKSSGVPFVLGLVLVIFAFMVKMYLDPIIQIDETPFLLSFVAVVIAALGGGVRPGIFTTLVAVIVEATLAYEKSGRVLTQVVTVEQIRLFTFAFEGIFVSALVDKLRESQERAVLKSKLLINSEKHLRNVINSLYAFVGVMTVNGILIEVNNAALDVANLNAEDVLGKPFEKTYWWNYSARSRRKFRKAIEKASSGETVRFDVRMRIDRDKFIIMDFTIVPIVDDKGRMVYLVPSGVDVSQRVETIVENKKLYQALDEEKARLEQIIANTPGVVWEMKGDPKGKLMKFDYVSDYVESLIGYSKSEIENDPEFWSKIIHPEDELKTTEEMRKVFESGKNGTVKFRWITKSGKELWVESRLVTIKDNKNRPIGMRGVTFDVNDSTRLEQKKDEFVGIASHELKTPITTVKAFTQILEKRLLAANDSQSSEYLRKMNIYINRLTKIIYDFLDFSKIQAGKLDLNEEAFDLDELVSEVVEDMKPTSDKHKIIFTNGVGNCKIHGDRNRISQVLINFITNAVKYSPEADRVEIDLSKSDNKAVVSVKDFGIGIPKDSQKQIFDRFYRVNQPKKIKIEGFGLGLFISAEIIKRHKGDVWFESCEGKGSTFHFSIPLFTDNIK